MGMYRNLLPAVVALLCVVPISAQSPDRNQEASPSWSFAISGDSRNCGDVVMPAIAADALKHNVSFYWHLGDLRLISGPDQDFIEQRVVQGKTTNLAKYQKEAWGDFIENQIRPWGEVPFYLGIGNNETIPPKTRALFIETFREYLNRADLHAQRLKDDPSATEVKTYFHWVQD